VPASAVVRVASRYACRVGHVDRVARTAAALSRSRGSRRRIESSRAARRRLRPASCTSPAIRDGSAAPERSHRCLVSAWVRTAVGGCCVGVGDDDVAGGLGVDADRSREAALAQARAADLTASTSWPSSKRNRRMRSPRVFDDRGRRRLSRPRRPRGGPSFRAWRRACRRARARSGDRRRSLPAGRFSGRRRVRSPRAAVGQHGDGGRPREAGDAVQAQVVGSRRLRRLLRVSATLTVPSGATATPRGAVNWPGARPAGGVAVGVDAAPDSGRCLCRRSGGCAGRGGCRPSTM
jgi:hypothetical protein